MHPTSLPGRFGIGDLGPASREFADFLAAARQKVWQVLPLHPTGYGDSPYQCFSAFAGNPLLISPEALATAGLLNAGEIATFPHLPDDQVDFAAVIAHKYPLLRRAASNFFAGGGERLADFAEFCRVNARWLDEFALFMAAKSAHDGDVWTRWQPALARRAPEELAKCADALAEDIALHKFWQFEFHRQWRELREYCTARGIRVMGDVPIYVAHDSADVWANPELFWLDANGAPTKQAGVPPDYFSATGQLWGNPIYRWALLRERGYGWWIERLRAALRFFDVVRLDHFRGFEAYWEVLAGETTAMHGQWVKGPGAELFTALGNALGELPIVAENLGVITPEVEALRRQFGFPGMAILQFAFGTDPQAPTFRPHNYGRDLFAYTGTHDNDTAVGWWEGGVGDSTRSPEDVRREHAYARAYLGFEDEPINWVLIRHVLASVATAAVAPLQDVLGAGSPARMNIPGRPGGNWRWRFPAGALDGRLAELLRHLTVLFDR